MATQFTRSILERVEPRTLLAATAWLDNGLLTIRGTESDNAIILRRQGAHLRVKLDPKTHHFSGVTAVIIEGGGGDDRIDVGAGCGDVTLVGGEGNDHLIAGDGNDYLDGGAGDDVLDAGRGADQCSGGEGNDTIDYSHRTAGVRLGHGAARGETGENDFLAEDIEILVGGDGDDAIFITNDNPARDFVVNAGGGNDNISANIAGRLTVFCGVGDDFLELPSAGELLAFGGAGNDHLDGALSFSSHNPTTLFGEAGDDLIHPVWLDVTTADGGRGRDHLDLSQVTFDFPLVLDLRSDPIRRFERITGSAGDDLIIAGDNPILIFGGDYEEVGDTLIGGAGDDTLIGGWGDDLIIGNGGKDLMFGSPEPSDGGGDDLFVNGGDGERDTVNGMDGNDTADDDPLDILINVEAVR